MTGHLQKELAIPALMHQYAFRRTLDRQPAKDERPGRESQALGRVLSVQPDQLNRLRLMQLPFRN
jgi:hypothetical protein